MTIPPTHTDRPEPRPRTGRDSLFSRLRHPWVEPYSGRGRTRTRTSKAIVTVQGVLARQRVPAMVAVLCIFVARSSPLALPLLLRSTFAPILDNQPHVYAGREWSPDDLLMLILGAAVAITAVRAIANFAFVAVSGRSGHALVADLRKEMYNHILRLPLTYSEQRETGKIMLRFIGDSDALRLWVSRTRPAVYVDLAMLLLTSAAMIWVDRALGLLSLGVIIATSMAIAFQAPRLRALTRTSRSMQSGFTGHVQARVDVIREAKWLDSMPGFRQMTAKLARAIARKNAARERVSAIINSLGEFSLFLLVPPLIWIGVRRVWAGSLTPGDLVALAWLAIHLGTSMQRLSSAISIHQKAQVSLQRIVRLLGRPSERGRSASLPSLDAKGESIEFDRVVPPGNEGDEISFSLGGKGIHVLDAGVPFLGVLDALLGFGKIANGKVRLDGQDLTDCSVPSVRAAIGWVPADPAIFDVSVGENVLMGKPSAGDESVARAMSEIGIEKGDPEAWLAQTAGPKGRNLTAAERYEIALLRVALRRAKFILIEPVTDAGAFEALRRALESWSRESLVVVDHRNSDLPG